MFLITDVWNRHPFAVREERTALIMVWSSW
nr:MAG TPA: hypothetical protein [Caudoviricetes sp.]